MRSAPPDAPGAADARAVRSARRVARERVSRAKAVFVTRAADAFREELGTTVRSVSPFLLALLGQARVDLATERLEPVPDWPRRPEPGLGVGRAAKPHTLRHWYSKADADRRYGRCPRAGERARARALAAGGAEVIVHVVAHSIEASVDLGPARFETEFGLLRIELPHNLPGTLVAGLPGKPIEAVVDHPALRGWGWTVAEVEEDLSPCFGTRLVVETGSLPYLVPWVR